MKLELVLLITGLIAAVVDAVLNINVTAAVGKTALLPCTVPVNVHTVIWTSEKLGTISVNTDVKKMRQKFKLLDATKADRSLEIKYVEMDDEDTYSCIAGGFYRTKVKLTVGVTPYFDGTATKKVSRNANETLTLTCDAKGIPPPEKKWYRIDKETRLEIFTEIRGNELHLPAEDHTSEQSYLCLARNTHGHATITYTVQTSGRSRKVSDRKAKQMPDHEPQPTQYVTRLAKTTAGSKKATQSKGIIKSSTHKARSGRVEGTSSAIDTKPMNIMTIVALLLTCYFGAASML